ncbi:MAG: hypothetical protein FWC34_09155 [Bacteroidetes bacterium]|nr:hypothetical protein [Bacteroidota bacterium]
MPGCTKEELVFEWSEGGTTSLSEFYELCPTLYLEMLQTMDKAINDNVAIKKARSGVLKVMQKLGIDTTNWKDVNAYLESRKICNGKRLYHLSLKELNELRKKLEAILSKQ